MRTQYVCPTCLVTLSERQKECPNCHTPNPCYDPAAKREPPRCAGCGAVLRADQQYCTRCGLKNPRYSEKTAAKAVGATVGKCAFCDSDVRSDEAVCPHCGAPNPNYVVHPEVTREGNASTGKCPYCGGTLRSNQRFCPSCGSENPHYTEDTANVIVHPRTIDELKEYCAERDMPLLRMRFFIGEDYHGPRAFGVYKDGNGKCIVYKNKADGSRTVRYAGPDEAHAVDEIWKKLLDECRSRGINPDRSLNGVPTGNTYGAASQPYRSTRTTTSRRTKSSRFGNTVRMILFILAMLFVLQLIMVSIFRRTGSSSTLPNSGSGSGYSYDYDSGSSSGWDWDDWDSGSSWDSDDDWDSGSSWDDWDSGGSDWDSDW